MDDSLAPTTEHLAEKSDRQKSWRHLSWIFLTALLVFFTNLGGPQLFDEDEPRNAACGMEMFARGDWVVPTFNQELRVAKPAMLYWLMIVSYKLFGVNEFAARFWSAVLAVGTVLLTYGIGRRLFSREAGFWAAIALSSSLMFVVAGRIVTPDSTLIFFSTLSLYLFVCGVSARNGGHFCGSTATSSGADSSDHLHQMPGSTDWQSLIPSSWPWFAAMYVAMGLAVLTKGPVGVLLPCTVIVLFLSAFIQFSKTHNSQSPESTTLVRRIGGCLLNGLRLFQPRRLAAIIWSGRPLLAALVVAAVALPWYVLVAMQTDGAWIEGFLGRNNVGRFLSPMEKHSGPPFYYVIAVFAGFFPWSVFLPATLISAWRQGHTNSSRLPSYLFLGAWVSVYFVFFSLAATKLPNYVLPMYPALALLTGRLIQTWLSDWSTVDQTALRNGIVAVGVVAVVGLIALPIASYFVLPGGAPLMTLFLIPLVGAAIAFRMYRAEAPRRAVVCFSITAVSLATCMLGVAAPRVSPLQDGVRLATIAKAHAEDMQLGTYRYFSPNLVFYSGRRVETIRQPTDAAEYLQGDASRFIVLQSKHFEEIEHLLPEDTIVVERQPRFLRNQELLLLGRTSQIASLRDETRVK